MTGIHQIFGHGLVSWRQRDMLQISGFMDNIIFARTWKKAYCQSNSTGDSAVCQRGMYSNWPSGWQQQTGGGVWYILDCCIGDKKTKLMLCWCGDSQGVPHQVAGAADRHQHQEVVSARAEPWPSEAAPRQSNPQPVLGNTRQVVPLISLPTGKYSTGHSMQCVLVELRFSKVSFRVCKHWTDRC